jgi:tRNA(adenine34) deaminase
MCAGALGWSQVSEIVFGASDEKKGYSAVSGTLLHPKTKITGGILEGECSELVKKFFRKKR